MALGAVLAPPELAALDPGRRLTQYNVAIWGVEEGLPSLSVACIAQTPDGYLWIGTTEGLARFDGVRFKVYDRWNTPAFRLNEVRTLFVDSRGALWIGFAGAGAVVKEGESFRLLESADFTVFTFAEDAAGILIGSDRGLLRLRRGGPPLLELVELPARLAGAQVVELTVDARGALWLGVHDQGVFRWHEGRLSGPARLGSEAGPGGSFASVRPDARGGVLLLGPAGIYAPRDGELEELVRESPPGDESLFGLLVDRAGVRWLSGFARGGARRLVGGVVERFPEDHPLIAGRFSPYLEDREGNLWLGSWTRGLMRLSDGPFASWSRDEGLAGDAVRALAASRSGAIWVGTTDGLSRIEQVSVESFTLPRGSRSSEEAADWVYSLAETADGAIAIGSRAGLFRLEGSRVAAWPDVRARFSTSAVFSLLAARDGALWLGLDAATDARTPGVARLAADAIHAVPVRPIIAYDLLEDRRGSVWVAGKNGLYEVRAGDEVVKHETPVEPLHALYMSAAEDSRGDLWFGTLEGGVLRYRDGEFRRLRRQDGLFDDTAWAIVDDGLGYLWVSCARGVYRMALADLDAYLDGRLARLSYRRFGVEDGLKSAVFEGGNGDAGIRAADGRLWFATMRGAAVVDPRQVVALPRVPARIEEVRVDGRVVEGAGPLALAAGRYRIEIDFTALHLRAPKRLRFRHRLSGVDADWIVAGDRRRAEYPAVPPGERRFAVEASLDGSSWGPAAELPLTVAPYWWQRWWFYALVGVALVAMGGTLQLARTAALRRRTRELEDVVDFGRAVAGVLDPGEIVRQLDRALVARWGEAPRLLLARREGRSPLVHAAGGAAALARRFATEASAEELRAAGLDLAAPLVSGETPFGWLAVAASGRRERSADLAHLGALAAQSAMALEGAWQAQEAVRWRHLSESRGEWLQLDLVHRLVFAAVARQGLEAPSTDATVRAALGEVLSGTRTGNGGQGTDRIAGAIERLVADRILARGAAGELRVERESWLLLPECRLPFAEIVRQATERVGAYQLLERIGAGGMGEVYRAVNVHDGSPAAVKLLFPEQTADPTARRRLDREGEIVAQLQHPNIVRLLERGEHGGRLYLAMELLSGETLAERLRRGRLAEPRALAMAAQIAAALAELHRHGVVHRDLTAGNVMCLPEGRFVLLDFGLARGAARATLTETATLVGTLPYMAPEVLRAETVDERSDLWSLGVVLWEALAGHLPWGEGAPTLQMALAVARLEAPIAPPPALAARPAVAALLARLLEPVRARRAADAATLAVQLGALAGEAATACGERPPAN